MGTRMQKIDFARQPFSEHSATLYPFCSAAGARAAAAVAPAIGPPTHAGSTTRTPYIGPPTHDQATPLHFACIANNFDNARMLVRYTQNVNVRDNVSPTLFLD